MSECKPTKCSEEEMKEKICEEIREAYRNAPEDRMGYKIELRPNGHVHIMGGRNALFDPDCDTPPKYLIHIDPDGTIDVITGDHVGPFIQMQCCPKEVPDEEE